jgi:NADPH:quinone reductase-like Zn-dependent oxidoreductase
MFAPPRTAAAGVSPVDGNVRSGAAHEVFPVDLPAIPGRDAVGVVDVRACFTSLGAVPYGAGLAERLAALAHAYAERGHTRGKIVIRI